MVARDGGQGWGKGGEGGADDGDEMGRGRYRGWGRWGRGMNGIGWGEGDVEVGLGCEARAMMGRGGVWEGVLVGVKKGGEGVKRGEEVGAAKNVWGCERREGLGRLEGKRWRGWEEEE